MDDRMPPLATTDYPLAEKRADLVRTRSGKTLGDLTLQSIMDGAVTLQDLRITPEALRLQAQIAAAAGRPALARNFERAAEIVDVPQDVVLGIYELLRPGRAKGKAELLEAARRLRETYGATRMAEFVTEAAEMYERRGLFTYRF